MRVAIDLGTSFSLVAVVDSDGQTHLLGDNKQKVRINHLYGLDAVSPVLFQRLLMPSAVAFIPQTDQLLVGRQALEVDGGCDQHFKRHMGTGWTNCSDLSATELSSFVLQALKRRFDEHYSEAEIELCTITVPAYFNATQRAATFQAAELAGFDQVTLLSEPTASALFAHRDQKDDVVTIVLDLGGGTFDVSVVESIAGLQEVKAIAGDARLGGIDVIHLVQEHLETRFSVPSEIAPVMARRALHQLGDKPSITIEQAECEITLDQDWLIAETQELADRMRRCIERAVLDSGLSPYDFDEVCIVGGASRLQFFRRLVRSLFLKAPKNSSHPDFDVVLGASLHVQSLNAAADGSFSSPDMLDVLGHTIGVAVSNSNSGHAVNLNQSTMLPLLARTDLLPIARKTRLYSVNRESRLKTAIYQGESRSPEKNEKLAELEVVLNHKGPREDSFWLEVKVDISGLLHLRATTEKDGQISETETTLNGALLSQAAFAEARERLEKFAIVPEEHPENAMLLAEAEELYEILPSIHQAELATVIFWFEHAIYSFSRAGLIEARAAFRMELTKWRSNASPFSQNNDRADQGATWTDQQLFASWDSKKTIN